MLLAWLTPDRPKARIQPRAAAWQATGNWRASGGIIGSRTAAIQALQGSGILDQHHAGHHLGVGACHILAHGSAARCAKPLRPALGHGSAARRTSSSGNQFPNQCAVQPCQSTSSAVASRAPQRGALAGEIAGGGEHANDENLLPARRHASGADARCRSSGPLSFRLRDLECHQRPHHIATDSRVACQAALPVPPLRRGPFDDGLGGFHTETSS